MAIRKVVEKAAAALEAAAAALRNGRHDAVGNEHLDTTPVAIPLRLTRTENLTQTISRLVAQEAFRRAVEASGNETEQEANDFDVPGDEPIPTPFEDAGSEELDELERTFKAARRRKEVVDGPVDGLRKDKVSEADPKVDPKASDSAQGSSGSGKPVEGSK